MKGALALLEGAEGHPGQLRWQICSPSGTTIAGMKAFEDAGVRAGLMNTFLAAYKRSKEIK
jgi:pyrroline-5-carboxylate reductase